MCRGVRHGSLSSCRGMTEGSTLEARTVMRDNRQLGIFRVSMSFFGRDSAQDQFVSTCNQYHISQSTNFIGILLKVINHFCRFIYPIPKMLNYLVTLVWRFFKTGFQVVDMFRRMFPVISRGWCNAEAGKKLMDSTIDIEMIDWADRWRVCLWIEIDRRKWCKRIDGSDCVIWKSGWWALVVTSKYVKVLRFSNLQSSQAGNFSVRILPITIFY